MKTVRRLVTDARRKLEKSTNNIWVSDAEPCNKNRVYKVSVTAGEYHEFIIVKRDSDEYENVKEAFTELIEKALWKFR